MQSFNFVNTYNGIKPADTPDRIVRKFGPVIADCCGSLLVTDLALDTTNWGATLAINDEPTSVVPKDDSEHIDSIQIGPYWFNIKLRMGADRE